MPDTREFSFDYILLIHLTVWVLLHSIPMEFLPIIVAASIITLMARTSSDSYKSEFLVVTIVLSWDILSLLIYSVNITLHTTI